MVTKELIFTGCDTEKIQILASKRVFLKQPKIGRKPFRPRPKGFLWEKMEILVLYTLRILKYNFILEINFAYPALRKNPNFGMKTHFFKTTQNWLKTL